MSSRRAPRVNFDRIARPYRWLEYLSLGTALERLRLHHLATLETCPGLERALILGDGDGRFTARLLARQPTLKAEAVDLSAAMLTLLERRCRSLAPHSAARLRLHHADALRFASARRRSQATGGTYDLVVTHFFLDCLVQPQVEQLITDLTPSLHPGSLWLLSEFRIPPGLLHWPARLYVRSLYLAFRALTGLRTTRLPDYEAALAGAGFERIALHRALAGLLTTELWQWSEQARIAPPACAGEAPPAK